MKKVLILYATYGGGHFSAAKSINNYITDHYDNVETQLVDCIEFVNKTLNKVSTGAYNRLTTNAPWAWKKMYYHSEKGMLSKISSGTNKIMARKINHLLEKYSPDLVISTHMFSTQMISYLKKKHKTNCALATVMTDFEPHEQWLILNEYGNYFFVSNEKMRNALINEHNIPSEKVYAYGIPISDKFSLELNSEEIYKTFDLDPSKKTLLFFGGGAFGIGKEKTVEIFRAITSFLDRYQVIAVSGKNQKMNDAFHSISEELGNPKNLKIFDFINNVPEAMHISDLVITKPGGLTTTESLASHLPMLLINPVPGQEEENAEFLEQAGAAIWLKSNDEAVSVLAGILESDEKLNDMRLNAEKLAHIDSTKKICDKLILS
ncbi:MAG: glycosyltransferase [Clostridia bacterium]|nr:glycosyltransferase [Clostridia bacterium]